MLRNKAENAINSLNRIQSKVLKKIDQIFSNIKIDKTMFFVFLSIFILQYFLSSVICMYFDDFGNASLSYSYVTPNVEGTNYTFSQLLEWAGQIYNNWGGRIFYAIFFIIPLLKNGISAYMFVQSVVVTFIIYFMYKIIKIMCKSEKNNVLIPIVLTGLYLCINIEFLRLGTFWASASVLYVWPMLPFFAFIYYYLKELKNIENGGKIKILKVIFLMFLAFLATFSQEQIGPGIIAFFVIAIICHHPKEIKKYLKLDLPIFVIMIASFLVLFLAPGNWKRFDSNAEFASFNIIQKIMFNYPKIIHLIFIRLKWYMIILTGFMYYMIADIFIKKYIKKGEKRYFLLVIFGIILIVNYLLLKMNSNLEIQSILLNIFGTIWFLVMVVVSAIYFYDNKIIEGLSLEFGAVSCIFCLLMSPVILERTGLPYCFFIIAIITLIMQTIVLKDNVLKYLIYLCAGIILVIGIKNSINIYEGYKNNYAIHQLNVQILQNYNEQEDGYVINLYKPQNTQYGALMPYEWEFSMDYWIEEYFNLPHKVEFNWVDIYEPIR